MYDDTQEPTKALEKGSESYKFLMNNSEDRIARIIHQNQAKGGKTALSDFNVDGFLEAAHPEVVLKIQNIQKKLEERETGKTGGFKEQVDRFFNTLAKLVGGGVKDKDIQNLYAGMQTDAKNGSIRLDARKSKGATIEQDKPTLHPDELKAIKGNLQNFATNVKTVGKHSKRPTLTRNRGVKNLKLITKKGRGGSGL